jgi:hypothetical protein
MELNITEQKDLTTQKMLIIDNPPQDIIGVNNLWDDSIENAAKEIRNRSNIYKSMHIYSAQKANKLYNNFMYLSIVLGPTAGVLSGIITNFNGDTQKVLSVLITILSFISGIVATILKFGKFDEESNANKLAASKYTSLENNVRRQLALSRTNRIPAKDYIDWINRSFDELFIASPLLSEEIFLKYEKKAIKNGIRIRPQTSEDDVKDTLQLLQKKSKTYNNIQDINHYDDGRMNYEMKRFLYN